MAMTSDPVTTAPHPRAVRFANVGHFYSHVFMLLYPTVVLALEVQWKLPYGELLALALPGFVLYGVAALPAGWIADRWSGPGMMAIYFVGTGASAIVTGLATGPFQLGVGLTLIGLFNSIYHPVGTSFIVRHATNRARALGTNGVFGTAGIALAAIIAGSLTDGFGWRAAFMVPGAVAVLTGIAFVFVVGFGEGARSDSEKRLDAGVTRQQAVRALMILGITILSIGLIAQALQVALPKVFSVRVTVLGDIGLSGTAGLVSAALALAATGQIIGGILADRFPLKTVYITTYVLLAPLALLAASLTEVPLVVASAFLMLLVTASLPAENCLVAKFCPAAWHATAYGGKFVLGLGVSSLALPMVGVIFDTTGSFYWVYMALAALGAVTVCFACLLPVGTKQTPTPAAVVAE